MCSYNMTGREENRNDRIFIKGKAWVFKISIFCNPEQEHWLQLWICTDLRNTHIGRVTCSWVSGVGSRLEYWTVMRNGATKMRALNYTIRHTLCSSVGLFRPFTLNFSIECNSLGYGNKMDSSLSLSLFVSDSEHYYSQLQSYETIWNNKLQTTISKQEIKMKVKKESMSLIISYKSTPQNIFNLKAKNQNKNRMYTLHTTKRKKKTRTKVLSGKQVDGKIESTTSLKTILNPSFTNIVWVPKHCFRILNSLPAM